MSSGLLRFAHKESIFLRALNVTSEPQELPGAANGCRRPGRPASSVPGMATATHSPSLTALEDHPKHAQALEVASSNLAVDFESTYHASYLFYNFKWRI